MANRTATIGILSLGDMGTGIAKILVAHKYRVITNIQGRGEATRLRAESVPVDLVQSDEELASQADYVFSIVPPDNALATAQRILGITSTSSFKKRSNPLYYLDLNAVSPATVREIADIFEPVSKEVFFVDGSIIGGPPKEKDGVWHNPSIPLSGPHIFAEARPSGPELVALLEMKQIADKIGQASGLKMCFAALSKGFTALAIQSFTTAHRLGVLPELQENLARYSPSTLAKAQQGLVGMPPKAYRWVREMQEINQTFEVDGGFEPQAGIFNAVSSVYKFVESTELGKETHANRVRGTSAEDVALVLNESLEVGKK